TAEVVHETLIRAWPRLRSWMDEDREFRTWQERVRDAMEVWHRSGNDHGDRDPDLLLRGSALEQARRWLVERPDDLHTALVEFIRLSDRTQQRRLDRDRRRVRLLAILLVLAVGLASFAALQLNRARQQSRLASSRLLAAQAISDVGTGLPRSLLLSLEALRLEDTAEARNALLTGLQSSPHLLS
ncbi:MAG TPA: hypothetical protein VKP64_12125, partial [Mycobacteriales bacterium]|nr:hypothetical protein [Mycobacteriales bacterium]